MTTSPTTNRCPLAESCWMGGGSYACVKTPPFCDEPLIPKEVMEEQVADYISACGCVESNVHAEPDTPIEHETPIQSAIKQGELF